MKLNGIAHIQLSVSDVQRSKRFYQPLMQYLEMKPIVDEPESYYCVGSRTGIALTQANEQFRGDRFEQRRIGLHHFCLRARSREDVDELFELMQTLEGGTVVHGPQEDGFAPGYYSILLEDPDGIRIEVNYVPGQGHLDPASNGVPVGML